MVNKNISLAGFKPKEHKDLRALKYESLVTRKAFEKLKDQKKHNSYEGDALLNKIDSITKEYNDKVKVLNTSTVFENQTSFNVTPFKGNKIGFSIGDLVGRIKIDHERSAVLVDKYNVTGCADILTSETMGTTRSIYDDT